MVYRETTNPPVATGDGMAAAYRAGAELRDMEFMQFHPTVLYVAGSSRYLISEAVRGEGAYLRDKDGDRFMLDVDPRAELAPRDVVAQAIVRRMERTQHPNVYLDLSHLDPDLRPPALPRHRQGLPRLRPGHHQRPDPGPARRPLHGRRRDGGPEGRTTLPGLWAAGEVTSSGLHGANRLASNSLLEGLVFGAAVRPRRGRGGGRACPTRFTVPPLSQPTSSRRPTGTLDVADMTNSLRSLMVPQHGHRPRPGRAAGGRADGRLLVPLRAGRASSTAGPAGSCRTC